MLATRDKILNASLILFNQHGVDAVSIRDITTKLKIRVGNFNYYFPTKNDIIYALCLEFISKVDEAVKEIFTSPANTIFEIMYRQADIIFSVQLKYRFIFTTRYAEIVSSIPALQQYYQKVLKIRFDEWMQFHTILVQQELAKTQLVEQSHSLSYILNILALFWHQEATIYFPEFTDKQKKEQGLSVMFHAYKPYLTEKGLNQLMPLLKKLDHY